MWSKLIISYALKKENRGKSATIITVVIGVLLLVPIIGVAALLAPALAIVGFFTSFFGTGIKAPVHPLQVIAYEVGCVANVFDINTIDIIENNLFPYTYSSDELEQERKHNEQHPNLPFYSLDKKTAIKNRYTKYYFDSIEVDFSQNEATNKLCGLRYVTDIISDIQEDYPNMDKTQIEQTIRLLKNTNGNTFEKVVDISNLRSHNMGLSSVFPNYNYLPSSRAFGTKNNNLYEWHDDIEYSHRGMDFPLKMGTEIYAMMDGTVVATASNKIDGIYQNGQFVEGIDTSLGNYVSVNSMFPGDNNEKSNSFINHMYLHLQQNQVFVKPGDKVKKGDLIGLSGNSGKSTGPHLDFRIHLTSPEMGLKNELINPYSLTLHDLYLGKFKEIN